MAVYAIGDVQGCFDELLALLERIEFNKNEDILWFAGDLVNRGPKSLDVLRFVKDLGDRAISVLGNHDLHLLAVADGHAKLHRSDTLNDILTAPDRESLLAWLRARPLFHHDKHLKSVLIHAGLPPQWDLEKAGMCAGEVEQVLQGPDYATFFKFMYGNRPEYWTDALTGWDRLRFITNCFTRLRYCDVNGRLLLNAKGVPGSQPEGYYPWFSVPGRRNNNGTIIFGHWSTLGFTKNNGAINLDTGCVWGGSLTAIRLDQGFEPISIKCAGACKPGV